MALERLLETDFLREEGVDVLFDLHRTEREELCPDEKQKLSVYVLQLLNEWMAVRRDRQTVGKLKQVRRRWRGAESAKQHGQIPF